MGPSEACVKLVKQFEGLSTTAYRDAVGVLTIGYGHTGPEVVEGLTWTPEQCEAQLAGDISTHAQQMEKLVTVPLTQGQYDALTDFVYNLGAGALKSSTLLRQLNLGNYDAARECLYWVDADGRPHGWVLAGGKVLPGLVARRKAEQELWNT